MSFEVSYPIKPQPDATDAHGNTVRQYLSASHRTSFRVAWSEYYQLAARIIMSERMKNELKLASFMVGLWRTYGRCAEWHDFNSPEIRVGV
jgi:hypothetical protein